MDRQEYAKNKIVHIIYTFSDSVEVLAITNLIPHHLSITLLALLQDPLMRDGYKDIKETICRNAIDWRITFPSVDEVPRGKWQVGPKHWWERHWLWPQSRSEWNRQVGSPMGLKRISTPWSTRPPITTVWFVVLIGLPTVPFDVVVRIGWLKETSQYFSKVLAWMAELVKTHYQ